MAIRPNEVSPGSSCPQTAPEALPATPVAGRCGSPAPASVAPPLPPAGRLAAKQLGGVTSLGKALVVDALKPRKLDVVDASPVAPRAEVLDDKLVERGVDGLYRAIKGFGTDEEAIYRVLEKASAPMREAIERRFNEKYRDSFDVLRTAIYGDFSGRDLQRVLEALDAGRPLPSVRADEPVDPAQVERSVDALRDGFAGCGTNEEAVYRVFEGCTRAERAAIETRFAAKYGNEWGSLRAALTDEMSGSELERTLTSLDTGGSVAPRLGTPEFEARLDQLTSTRVRSNSGSNLLNDGVNSFADRKRLMEAARQSIHLQTFTFKDDETAWETARLLVKRASEGVKVRVLYDAVGSMDADPVSDFMRTYGVEVRAYNEVLKNPLLFNYRWHEKNLVVDGEAAILGGINIMDAASYSGTGKEFKKGGVGKEAPWRDTDVRIAGVAVRDAQRAFLRDWEDVGGKIDAAEIQHLFPADLSAPENARVRVVQNRPLEDGGSNIEELYLQAIRASQHEILLDQAYFLPTWRIRQALIDAAQRGVRVEVYTNSIFSTDESLVPDVAHYYYPEMRSAGVKIFERTTSTTHAKTAVFDGQYSIVGSANFDYRSFNFNSEIVIATDSRDTARQLQRRFVEGLKEAHLVTDDDFSSFGEHLRCWLLSSIGWFL